MMNVLRGRLGPVWEYFRKTRVTEYIHEHCPEEADRVLTQARLLLNNTFVFTDRWDMEPCDEPYTVSLADWVTSPNGDPEWVFMLNRHDFLHKLWQAYLLTGQSCFHEKLCGFLLDWIAKNPTTREGTDATRTIDTGIRCMNWSLLLPGLLGEGLLSDADAGKILTSLGEQCRNLRERYIGKYALSNWGVLQTTAICTARLWFPEVIPADLAAWAWEELRTQLRLQILPDGSHWEQSPMYHVEVLNTAGKLLAQLQLARELKISMDPLAAEAICRVRDWTEGTEAAAGPGEGYDPDEPGWLAGAVRVLSRHVLYTCDPAFRQLPLGDSDVTDIRDVMARAAVMLSGSGIYRWAAGDRMDLDSVFLLGTPGMERFHSIPPVKPRRRVWTCADSGNIAFRSGWETDAAFTALKCGTLGSSHGHADQTHISLCYKGRPFLIDSGRYTYREEEPLRVLLKKACAHNVCVIDGQTGGEPNGSWSYHSFGETLKNYDRHIDTAHYAEMGFHGTLADGTPYLILRKLLALDQGIWLSAQDVTCQGEHQLKEYFHLDARCAVRQRPGGVTVAREDAALQILTQESVALRDATVSETYNRKHSAPVLIRTDRMRHRVTTFTVIADADYQVSSVPVYQMRRTEPVPQETAAAWDVVKPDGKKYTLILWNRETCRGDKLYTCHGISVYGKAVVLDWEDGVCRPIRLRV